MRAQLTIGALAADLPLGHLSDWLTLTFRAAPGVHVSGMTRVQLLEMDDHFSLYMSPLNLDPEQPVMPISHRRRTTRLISRSASAPTRLLAWPKIPGRSMKASRAKARSSNRPTTSMASGVRCSSPPSIDSAADRSCACSMRPIASSTCSGDISTRPIRRWPLGSLPSIETPSVSSTRRTTPSSARSSAALGEGDLLMVISDHGFSSFRRGVNLNAWLRREGYLTLADGASGASEWLRDVDWSQHARLLSWAHRPVPEHRRTRTIRHRHARVPRLRR